MMVTGSEAVRPARAENEDWASALLAPRVVALVGISDDPAKTSGRPLHFLRRAGFGRSVYVVNPGRDTVQGERAYAALADLPERPDHVFIATSTERALDSLEECGKLGVPVATILASGFAEIGAAGAENDRRIRALIDKYPTRVLGPSSIGLANLHDNFVLTANAAFAEPDLPRGDIFVGSHSGSLIGALMSRGKRQGVGFAGLVSVGSETDLSIGEICAATLDDPNIGSYLLFLETMRHADSLRRFAFEAARRGKPVAAYKLGRSSQAAELAVSHTGSLAGEDAVADIFLRECGIARVESFDGLLDINTVLRRVTPGGGQRVGLVTTTGGGGAMAVDQLGLRKTEVVPPSEATRQRLAVGGIAPGHGRIVDLTLAGTRYETMKATLDVLLEAPEFDLVLVTVGSSARFNPELAVRPVIDAAREHRKPLACYIVPDAPQAMQLLRQAGIPAFNSPEICGDVISAALRRKAPRAELENARSVASASAQARLLNEAEAYGVFAHVGVPYAPFKILDVAAAVPALPFNYPVVVKALHGEIAHKSDVGGVMLAIADADGLAAAMNTIKQRVEVALPGKTIDTVLVQPMVRGIGEVLIGLRHDPDVGPVVVLAAGGVFTELYRDSSMRMAPVGLAEAHEMIAEVKASRILLGYRGGQPGDIAALAKAIVAVSDLSRLTDTPVLNAEINPVIVLPEGEGVLAVDALVQLADGTGI